MLNNLRQFDWKPRLLAISFNTLISLSKPFDCNDFFSPDYPSAVDIAVWCDLFPILKMPQAAKIFFSGIPGPTRWNLKQLVLISHVWSSEFYQLKKLLLLGSPLVISDSGWYTIESKIDQFEDSWYFHYVDWLLQY